MRNLLKQEIYEKGVRLELEAKIHQVCTCLNFLFSKLDPSLVLRFFSCLLIILLYNKEPTEINCKIRISYWFDKNQSKLGFYGQKLEEIDRWFNLIWTFFSYKLIRWLRDQLKTGIYVNRFESVFIKWILNNLKKK